MIDAAPGDLLLSGLTGFICIVVDVRFDGIFARRSVTVRYTDGSCDDISGILQQGHHNFQLISGGTDESR